MTPLFTPQENVVSKSIANFTIDFHKNLDEKVNENLVCSALSAHLVLSMSAYGASGNTAREMRETLHLPHDDAQALQGFQDFINDLNNVPNVILKVANKIYASKDVYIKNLFKAISTIHFDSDSDVLDFSNDEQSAAKINQWCDTQTNGKIREIISKNDISIDTKMILLNAMYFKGNWKYKFKKGETRLKPFYVDQKTTVQVPTMHITKEFTYQDLRQFDAKLVALPYENTDLSLVIIVPKKIDGLREIEKNLENIEIAQKTMPFVPPAKIQLALPKFKLETAILLNQSLAELGMREMFSYGDNFQGISDTPLKVDKVLQKAFIEVNEEGTEAAVVTAMMMGFGSSSQQQKLIKLNVDRPFFFKITYKKDTLFSGHIVNPL